MILDLKKFIEEGQSVWSELETRLKKLEQDPADKMELFEIRRFHYLYQKTSADLARISTFASEPDLHQYLESLVVRAYGEIHETRERPHRLAPIYWFFNTFPIAFRKHVNLFYLSLALFLAGSAFGSLALSLDSEAKSVIMPWSHLQGSPSDRVADEEEADRDRLEGAKGRFSTYLMTHNTRVSIFTMALGLTYGVGTVILLFYNGVILGAVAMDYILAGETEFLAGWLLPHGTIEIPAILIAGQAGLILALALIGRGRPETLRTRFRAVTSDLVTIIFGVGVMLVWAGLVEAFMSQYHEPILPYWLKISFGLVEMAALIWFLSRSGKKNEVV